MSSVRLVERFNLRGKVDRSGQYPRITGCLLCGAESKNGRRYKREAFSGGRHKRYENKPVFLGHGDGRTARDYRAKIGWIENVRLNAAGLPVGDLALNPKHPEAEMVLWDAEHRPGAAGMSHVASCQTQRGKDKVEEVVSLEEVESVDIVLDPATTKNYWESCGSNRETVEPVPTTGKAFTESINDQPSPAYIAEFVRSITETIAPGPQPHRPAPFLSNSPVPTDGKSFADSIRN